MPPTTTAAVSLPRGVEDAGLPAERESASDTPVRNRALLEELVRRMLREVSHTQPDVFRYQGVNEIEKEELFRLRVDGVEYALVRYLPPPTAPAVGLSPREEAIVRLIIRGHSNKAIAHIIDISPWTVATHLRRVFAKLEVSSRSEMVARVLRDHLLIS
jgi:DNA-binding CsgD family transcriptional regulator